MKMASPFPYRRWMVENGAAAAAATPVGGLKGVIAGGITGGIEICITYPTEFVKTQLQLDGKSGAGKRFDGIVDCVRKTVRERGPLGLYRGLSVLVYGSIPKSAVRFGAFEELKSLLHPDGSAMTVATKLICGLGAGVGEAVFAVTPMETIKVKFINDQRRAQPQFRGFLHGVVTIVRTEGVGGLYKGLTPTVLKQGTNQMMRFYVMETLKDWYTGHDRTRSVPKPIIGVFGLFAGFVSVIGNTPLDVVKTRLQGLEAAKYKGTIDCATKIFREEGVTAFYKGTIPRMGRVCLDVAITFVIYETFLDIFNIIWR